MSNIETITVFKYNNFVVNKNLEGISQEDSLVSPANGGNCINWVLGHITVTRDEMLKEMGLEKICDEVMRGLYIQGSKPIERDTALDVNFLLKKYNESQDMIVNELASKEFTEEKIKIFAGFGFHEAYHCGQIGILRRVAGRVGVI